MPDQICGIDSKYISVKINADQWRSIPINTSQCGSMPINRHWYLLIGISVNATNLIRHWLVLIIDPACPEISFALSWVPTERYTELVKFFSWPLQVRTSSIKLCYSKPVKKKKKQLISLHSEAMKLTFFRTWICPLNRSWTVSKQICNFLKSFQWILSKQLSTSHFCTVCCLAEVL